MPKNEKSESLATCFNIGAVLLTLLLCYWRMAPSLAQQGKTIDILDSILLVYKDYFIKPYSIKGLCLLFMACAATVRAGKPIHTTWKTIMGYSLTGIFIYILMPSKAELFTMTSTIGLILCMYGFALIVRKLKDNVKPDEGEGFLQNEKVFNTSDSIDIPTRYIYQGQERKGNIAIVNPYRSTAILGSPGSGKSFACYNAFLEQGIRKNFTFFVYDYKFPDLTERVLTEITYQTQHENLWKNEKVKPKLYIINFDDARKSHRCNPIHHSYITDPTDTTEFADLVFKNINKGVSQNSFDFFNESAKSYLDLITWKLANYDPDALYNTQKDLEWIRQNRGELAVKAISKRLLGKMDGTTVIGSKTNYVNKGCYCTFPHIIEVMAKDYGKMFQILQYTKGMEAKISPFASALENNALEQLSGQIASAQIPLSKFVSPALYWVMTGNDFTLDINNPLDPKIVCMGNNPDRQSIYGTTTALYTARMFKLINHKRKRKSMIILDELPTIFIKGLDNLIATARSNKVAIVMGAQDESQIRRDYGDKEAEVIMSTKGNLLSGSVEGRTAETISKTFGKQYRKKISESIGEDSVSQSISYQLEDILPASEITDISQGTFCGWVKDDFMYPIKNKKFYGKIVVDLERNDKLEENTTSVPILTDFFSNGRPVLDDAERTRLQLMYPAIANNEAELQRKLEDEYVQNIINDNVMKIKADIDRFVEAEYERTKPMAAAAALEKQRNKAA